jgi:hypothetical protein
MDNKQQVWKLDSHDLALDVTIVLTDPDESSIVIVVGGESHRHRVRDDVRRVCLADSMPSPIEQT